MSAFFIANVSVKNPELFQEYAKKAGESIAPFGGVVMARGKTEGVLEGNCNHKAVGIVEFPDMESLDRWYNSDDYQKIIPLRDHAADINIIKYASIE